MAFGAIAVRAGKSGIHDHFENTPATEFLPQPCPVSAVWFCGFRRDGLGDVGEPVFHAQVGRVVLLERVMGMPGGVNRLPSPSCRPIKNHPITRGLPDFPSEDKSSTRVFELKK
jgi:hypothetical protein